MQRNAINFTFQNEEEKKALGEIFNKKLEIFYSKNK
jgi:hypothetical protein